MSIPGVSPRISKLYTETYNRVEKQLDKMKASPEERAQFRSLICSSVWSLASIQAWQDAMREAVKQKERNSSRSRRPDDANRNRKICEEVIGGLSDGAVAAKLKKQYPDLNRDKVRGVRTRANIPPRGGRI